MGDVLQLLIEERDKIDRAIAILQSAVPRRGRPLGSKTTKSAKRGRKKGSMSPAQRRAAAERMRAYWAARKKAAKKDERKKRAAKTTQA